MQCSAVLYTYLFLTTVFTGNLIAEAVTTEIATQHGITRGCILPHQPTGGRYQLVVDTCTGNSCNDVPGRRVPSGSFIEYRCHDGYVLMGEQYSSCRIDTWYITPTCVKVCRALRSVSVDFTCRYYGASVSCASKILPGTKATLTCKSFYDLPYVNDPGYREITCLDDGTWDRMVFNCIAECGIETVQAHPTIINGSQAAYLRYPWHVGIYKRSGVDFEQICGGTLVSPHLVVSAAHCFWDDRFKVEENATEFAVAVGKYYRPYNISSWAEPNAQKSAVKKIEIAERYFGFEGNYACDIALLRLERPFVLSTLVKPICMHWDKIREPQQLRSGMQGKAVGWGKTETGNPSAVLREINLPYVPYYDCRTVVPEDFKRFITADKFCAGYLNNGSSVCDGDSGGGFYIKFEDRWYLRGIVSVGPRAIDGSCDSNQYSTFTDVTHFREWIRNVNLNPSIFSEQDDTVIIQATTAVSIGGPTTAIPTSGCILPEQPMHGNFELGSCEGQCIVVPGTRVPLESFLVYRCNEGYVVNGNNVAVCRDNAWSLAPTCVKNCPIPRFKAIDLVCSYQGKNVSCESRIDPGTKATLRCKDYYKTDKDYSPGNREITCLEEGLWSDTSFHCIPECGRAVAADDGTRVIGSRSNVNPARFPWLVLIYNRVGSGYSYHCEGTLISPNLVLSIASCLIRNDVLRKINASEYAVSAGKYTYHDSYDTPDPDAQKSLVSRIIIHDAYKGSVNRYADDIALLRLETSFEMTKLVRPICLDWTGEVEEEVIARGNGATITGWIIWPTGYGYEVRSKNTSYISPDECYSLAPAYQRHLVTNDTFCVPDWPGWSFASLCPSIGYGSHGLWYMQSLKRSQVFSSRRKPYHEIYMYKKIGGYLNWIRGAIE